MVWLHTIVFTKTRWFGYIQLVSLRLDGLVTYHCFHLHWMVWLHTIVFTYTGWFGYIPLFSLTLDGLVTYHCFHLHWMVWLHTIVFTYTGWFGYIPLFSLRLDGLVTYHCFHLDSTALHIPQSVDRPTAQNSLGFLSPWLRPGMVFLFVYPSL